MVRILYCLQGIVGHSSKRFDQEIKFLTFYAAMCCVAYQMNLDGLTCIGLLVVFV